VTEALFKSTSDAARSASLRLSVVHEEAAPQVGIEEPAVPSAQEIEIARLENENGELKRQLKSMQAAHVTDLEKARRKAFEEAAGQHVRDDARAFDAIDRALSVANRQFESFLSGSSGPAATKLAATAVARLVELRREDEDWLARVTLQRMSSIAANARMVIHVAPDVGAIMEESLAANGRSDVEVKIDKSIAPGTARIALRLGEIDIDPSQGAAAIIALLEGVERSDG
jgi:flagellar biosynthesis/type III secretory pathway protein FliH